MLDASAPAVSGSLIAMQMHLCGRLGSIWLWQQCVKESGVILKYTHSMGMATEVSACSLYTMAIPEPCRVLYGTSSAYGAVPWPSLAGTSKWPLLLKS